MFRILLNSIRRSLYTSSVRFKNDIEKLEKIKILVEKELQYREESGAKVPIFKRITEDEFMKFDNLSARQRRNLYADIRDKQNYETKQMIKKQAKKAESLENKRKIIAEREHNNHIIYGLGANTLLPRIRSDTIRKWRYERVFQTLRLYQHHIIFDCSYQYPNNDSDSSKFISKLIKNSFDYNLLQKFPFYINLYNLQDENGLKSTLQKTMPNIEKPSYPISVRNECFTKDFSPDHLIYLSSDSRQILCIDDLKEKTLIVGALDNKTTNSKFSLKRAKQFGIQTRKFPIDEYAIGFRSRTLEIDVVMKILHHFQQTNDWRKSLSHVPSNNNKI